MKYFGDAMSKSNVDILSICWFLVPRPSSLYIKQPMARTFTTKLCACMEKTEPKSTTNTVREGSGNKRRNAGNNVGLSRARKKMQKHGPPGPRRSHRESRSTPPGPSRKEGQAKRGLNPQWACLYHSWLTVLKQRPFLWKGFACKHAHSMLFGVCAGYDR